jgi:hypothetical protein
VDRSLWRRADVVKAASTAVTIPTVLAATWRDGLFVINGTSCDHEFAGHPVKSLTSDGHGGALAVVDGHSLWRRASDDKWRTITTSDIELACSVAVGDVIYVGTDDAHVLRINGNNSVEQLGGFDAVAGRDAWYAGSALINGQRVGPPLGIRSITATSDRTVLLANVHVGGIPRSTDGGVTWQPTIDIDSDIHEVRAHPTHPGIVVAAGATGLCTSTNGGATWRVEQEGLHASYCSAVAFSGDDILVAAAADHFAVQGAIYRRPIDGPGPLVPVGGGLPRWIDGIADTTCIAALASAVAVADRASHLYVSRDGGRMWVRHTDCLPTISSILIV